MDIQFLLKFGRREDIESLQKHGHIYINHLNFFRKASDNGRFDRSEGRSSLFHLQHPVVELRDEDSKWKKLNVGKMKVETWWDIKKLHIYSMYQISTALARENIFFKLPSKMKSMGNSYLLIKNPNIFIERMKKWLDENRSKYLLDTVGYYNAQINQEVISLFQKPEEYDYQNEFRLTLEFDIEGPIQFKIGSLEDISEICDSNKYEGFRFVWQ